MATVNDHFDVAIVGCGAAGIGAAIKFKMLEPTARILVLEGRNRIGGRAFTDIETFGVETPVDLGARWLCHHQSNNVLRPYFTLSDKDWVESFTYDKSSMIIFNEDGTQISDDLLEQAQTTTDLMLAHIKEFASNQDDISIFDAINERLASISDDEMRRLILFCLSFTEKHEGSNLSELSVKLYGQGEGALEECDLALANGFGSFVKQIADQYSLPIELNTIVTRIDTLTRLDRLIHITTQDKRSYLCKYVLITVPLGCLKKRSIDFIPPLPTWKLEAIDQMGIGLLNKVYLQFSTTFWDPKLKRISVVTDRFQHYYCIPHARILVLYIAGKTARELEQTNDEAIVEQIVNSLRKIYPYISKPIKWIVTRWGSDPFSYGAYSSFHVGNNTDLLKALAKETHDNRVYWAGEHTNYNGCIGYVDGAFETGEREALRIYNKLTEDVSLNTS